MTRGCLLLLLVVMACTKAKESASENKDGSAAPAPAASEKKTDKTAADVMKASIEEAKAKAAAQTPPPPPPVTPTPPADPLPPETPPAPPPDPVVAEPTEAPAAMDFKVGDRVMAKWDNAKWYPGKIVGIKNGKYDVDYDDGDKSRGLSPTRVRKPGASTSSGGGGAASKPSGDAPCPGPGITRRCNGKCVNIQDDDNHCGGCNNRCPSGKHCDGHLFCRDADGNL